MTIAQPRIGMDRYVDADWMALAASVVRGEMEIDGLHDRLAHDITGVAVRKKTVGILNRIWFPTDRRSRELVADAAALMTASPAYRAAAFEAVAVAAYPYFRQIVENVGRLVRLQGSCSAGEVHRRMFEQHGKRTTIDQATSYGFKTMVSWGILARDPDQRLWPAEPLQINAALKHLLDRGANISRVSVSPLQPSDPLLFPFRL